MPDIEATTPPAATGSRVFTQGQKRGVSPAIKKPMQRRAAIEPVIGHVKNEHPAWGISTYQTPMSFRIACGLALT